MTPSSRRPLRTVVALTGTVLALAWVWTRIDPTERADAFAQVDPAWLGLAILLVPLQTLLAAERWLQVSRSLGLQMTRAEAWTEFGLSTAVNQLLPGGVGGDVLRVWRQRELGLARATRSAITDRWWGQTALMAFALLGFGLWPLHVATPDGLTTTLIVAGLVVTGLWFVPSPVPIMGPLSCDLRTSARGRPVVCSLLSTALVLTILAGFAACGQAVAQPSLEWVWSVAPLALLATSLPISAGGWGLREGSLVLLLPLFGWPEAQAFALSVCFGLTFAVGALPGLLVLVSTRARVERAA